MTVEWKHLTPSSVKAIHREVLIAHGGGEGLCDEALLESAVAAPQAIFDGEPMIADGIDIAAAYLFYLCRNHPFVDGNKRTALAVCLVFLAQNGIQDLDTLPVDEWEQFTLEVAASKLDREQTTKRLRDLVKSS